MLIDLILGLAVVGLAVSHLRMRRELRRLTDAHRPVDFVARRQLQLESEARIRKITAEIRADHAALLRDSSSQSPTAP